MSMTIRGNTSYRANYAKQCILRGGNATNTRAFNNCFEMGDGDEVVRRIMRYALTKKGELIDIYNGKTYSTSSPEWKADKAERKRLALLKALENYRTLERWTYFYNYGSYEGYEPTETGV